MSKTKRGRPRTSDPNDTNMVNRRRATARYYAKNREKILKRAHDIHVSTYVPVYSPPYVCEHCGKEFKSAGGLGGHLWSRGQTNRCRILPRVRSPPFICEHCGREFSTGSGLGKHLWWRSVKKGCRILPRVYFPPYICEHCGDEFTTGGGLGVHLWWYSLKKGCWEERTREA